MCVFGFGHVTCKVPIRYPSRDVESSPWLLIPEFTRQTWAEFSFWKSSLLSIPISTAVGEGTIYSPLDFCNSLCLDLLPSYFCHSFHSLSLFLKCNSFDVCHILKSQWLLIVWRIKSRLLNLA